MLTFALVKEDRKQNYSSFTAYIFLVGLEMSSRILVQVQAVKCPSPFPGDHTLPCEPEHQSSDLFTVKTWVSD